jgi:hypothetical protein
LDVICLIAAPKAGTERLCEVLEHFGDLASFPNAGESLGWLESTALGRGCRVMSFPLFDGDLRVDDLANRPDIRFVLVVRKQIDAYLDLLCADGSKPNLDAKALGEWLTAQERWYDRWRNLLNRRGLPCPVLRYESDIEQPAERVMRRFSAAASQLGVLLKLPTTLPDLPLPPKPPAPIDRVGNWVAFTKDVFALGLERRAYGYPL